MFSSDHSLLNCLAAPITTSLRTSPLSVRYSINQVSDVTCLGLFCRTLTPCQHVLCSGFCFTIKHSNRNFLVRYTVQFKSWLFNDFEDDRFTNFDVGACISKNPFIRITPIMIYVQVEIDAGNVDAATGTVRFLLNVNILLAVGVAHRQMQMFSFSARVAMGRMNGAHVIFGNGF